MASPLPLPRVLADSYRLFTGTKHPCKKDMISIAQMSLNEKVFIFNQIYINKFYTGTRVLFIINQIGKKDALKIINTFKNSNLK
jgi:hypothetical protein